MRALPLLLLLACSAAQAAPVKRPVPVPAPADGALGPRAVEAANPQRPRKPPPPPDPPYDLVDFLGRRSRCLYLGTIGFLDRPAARADYRRLRCDDLRDEEAALRLARASDPAATYWLDRNPYDFHLERLPVSRYDRSTPPRLRRLDQAGTDEKGGNPFRLTIDLDAAGGRSTRIRLERIGGPSRTIFLDNGHFERLDLSSLTVRIETHEPKAPLQVSLRYGDYRGYCVAASQGWYDDRSSLYLALAPDGTLTATRNDVVNCEPGRETLDPAKLSRAPGA